MLWRFLLSLQSCRTFAVIMFSTPGGMIFCIMYHGILLDLPLLKDPGRFYGIFLPFIGFDGMSILLGLEKKILVVHYKLYLTVPLRFVKIVGTKHLLLDSMATRILGD